MKMSHFFAPRSLSECVFVESADPFSWSVSADQLKKIEQKQKQMLQYQRGENAKVILGYKR